MTPPRWASFSSTFSIVLSLASNRIAELGCASVGEGPKAFVDRGGLRRLETEAAEAAIRRVREAAYPLIFKLFGSNMPRGKQRKLIFKRPSACVLTRSGARQPNVEGNKPDGAESLRRSLLPPARAPLLGVVASFSPMPS
jgi:hypothetical protein